MGWERARCWRELRLSHEPRTKRRGEAIPMEIMGTATKEQQIDVNCSQWACSLVGKYREIKQQFQLIVKRAPVGTCMSHGSWLRAKGSWRNQGRLPEGGHTSAKPKQVLSKWPLVQLYQWTLCPKLHNSYVFVKHELKPSAPLIFKSSDLCSLSN